MEDVIYLDYDEELYFSCDLKNRVYTDWITLDKNKPNVYIRTTKDITYLLPENHPDLSLSPITDADLDSINLLQVIAYYNGNRD